MANFTGSSGNNTQSGTNNDDRFDYSQGGDDTLTGLGGNDTFLMGAALTPADAINGGSGNDTLKLSGDYIAVSFAADTIKSIETIKLAGDFYYSVSFADGNVAAGATLVIDGSGLGAASTLISYSGAETDGHVDVRGGAGMDSLFGGRKSDALSGGGNDDYLAGSGGADTLRGGGGADQYDLARAGEPGSKRDTFIGFDAQADTIAVGVGVDGINPDIDHGIMNEASFDADLEAAIGPAALGKHNAVLFVPHLGDLFGRVFLVIDQNGKAGYQAGKDHVVELAGAQHLGDLTEDDFLISH
jgi:Ca2+-binding RTX toxin-like protein